MRMALLPGLALALAGGMLGSYLSQPADNWLAAGNASGDHALFSVAAQATPTSTLELPATIAATTVVTGEATITATGTLTAPAATPPPLELENPPPGPALGGNPLDPQFLFSAPPPEIPIGPLAWVFLAFMVGLAFVSGYFYMVKRPEWKRTNSVLHRAASRWGQVGLWISALGIIFLLFRVVRLDFFNLRFWLYFWMLMAVISAAWFFYWYRTQYPKQLARYTKRQRARQYAPGATVKGPSRPVPQPSSSILPRRDAPGAAPPTTAPVGTQRKRRKRK